MRYTSAAGVFLGWAALGGIVGAGCGGGGHEKPRQDAGPSADGAPPADRGINSGRRFTC